MFRFEDTPLTSTPELVMSVQTALADAPGIAQGNIIGSNIYNIPGIGGAAALMAPCAVPDEIVTFDNLVMVGMALALVAFAWTGFRAARWEGAVLLAGYMVHVSAIWP